MGKLEEFIDTSFEAVVRNDNELAELVEASHEYIRPEDLKNYIEKVRRFNKTPVHISYSLPGECLFAGIEKIVYWYHLRRDLELFPEYFINAQAVGLTYKQATKLLFNMVDTKKYEFSAPETQIEILCRIFENCQNKNMSLKGSLKDFNKLFAKAKEDGEHARALGILNLSIAAGFSVKQGVETVLNIYEHAWNSGYGMMGLYDELNALKTHSLAPDKLFDALQVITKSRGSYQLLAEGLSKTFAVQGNDGAGALLTHVLKEGDHLVELNGGDRNLPKVLRNEEGFDPIGGAIRACFDEDSSTRLTSVDLAPEEYFPRINTRKLIHGVMPYRLQRHLSLGITDLKTQRKGDFTEGMFIYDPDTETWYSLGGRTRLEQGKARHEFFTYNVSRLSSSPIAVHVHPKEAETFLTPPREALTHTCMQTRLTKFFAAVPSAADYEVLASLAEGAKNPFQLRGMIVTSSGLTAFCAPFDAEKVKAFSKTFLALKDEVLLSFDVDRYLARGLFAESDEEFARSMVGEVHKRLPKGFEIIIRPYDEVLLPQPEAPVKQRRHRQVKQHKPFP